MTIPAFSIFSAVSELFVTAAVLYAVVRELRGGGLAWRLLGGVLLFEVLVNVVYMARRAAQADAEEELSPLLRVLYPAHGMLSLLMLAALVVVYLLAVGDMRGGRATWFRRHAGLTWGLIVLWVVSVLSGELIFVLRYGSELVGA